MATPARPTSALRFGPYVLSIATEELRKGEIPLKLHPQPFRVLVMLAERSGTVVTREEIQHALWGGHTWVDFDGGINFCVRQIRAVLSDDAENPKYVETVARKGYRFVAPVMHTDSGPVIVPFTRAPSSPAPTPLDANVDEALPAPSERRIEDVGQSAQAPTIQRRSSRIILVAAILCAGLVASLVTIYLTRGHKLKLTQKDTVVIADFRNTTGDPVFDGTLQQWLSAQLQQSPFLNLVSDSQIQQTLRMMKQPPETKLTGQIAAEICQRTNGAAVLAGSIAQVGTQYDLILKAVSCSNGEALAISESEASDKNHVLRALGQAAADLREKLGESLATVQKFDMPLVQATTPSLEALKAYSLAYAKYSRGDQAGAIPFFQQAIELDPEFAMAYANLGRAYQVTGKGEEMKEALGKAYALRDRASERERFDIVAVYHQFVTRQIEKSIENCELWEQSYPRDFTPHRILGFEYGVLGKYEQSAREFSKATELDPEQALPYAGLIIDLTALRRFPEAHGVYEQAKARHLDSGEVERNFYMTAFTEEDQNTMAQLAASLTTEAGYASKLLLEESSNASYFGHYAAARQLFARAKSASMQEKNTGFAAWLESYMGIREAVVGNTALARNHAAQAARLGDEPALALALAGDTAEAAKYTERLAGHTLPDSFEYKVILPELRGAIELERGNATVALEMFQAVAPYESGWFDRYTAAYLRGQAYLVARRAEDAVTEFQKIVDHPGIVINSEISPLARLGLGRAYAIEGDRVRARTAYQEFFEIWKDADPDIPVLVEAKAEYAKLQ